MDMLIKVLTWCGKALIAMIELAVFAIGGVAAFIIGILAGGDAERKDGAYSDAINDGWKNANARSIHETIHGEGTYIEGSYKNQDNMKF
jgi:hypothetical protein